MSDSVAIASAIITAPSWAIISLTMPDEQMRERGAEELARWITSRIDSPQATDHRQLGLPL